MLRITIDTVPERTTLVVEGRFAGPWVEELLHCWQELLASRAPGDVRIDLDGVSFVDDAGKAALAAIHAAGGSLCACNVMMRAVIDEITTSGSELPPPSPRAQRRHDGSTTE